MSDTKFTKGKWWACVDEDSCWVDSVEGGLITDLSRTDVSIHESDSNAHLIAAAPEMYELLKDLFDNYEGLGLSMDNQIEKLLAKARGE